MSVHGIAPILLVTDIERALEFYCSILGFEKDFEFAFDENGPHYVGVSLENHSIHLSTYPGDSVIGAKIFCFVDDADRFFDRLVLRGLPENHPRPADQEWGMREVQIVDPDGNTIRFGNPVDYNEN